MKTDLDLYSDYLVVSFGQTTSTGLSKLLDNSISHDDVTRFLTQTQGNSKSLWHEVKGLVRQIESEDGVLIIDDTIIEKAYTDINGLISVHYDHSKDRYVQGINLVSAIYQSKGLQAPVCYENVVKTLRCDLKDRKEVWKSERTKNDIFRDLVSQTIRNQLSFRHLLCDSWYTNAENINHVLAFKKHLIGAVKSNLEIALSKKDRAAGKFQKINQLKLSIGCQLVYMRSVNQPVLLCKDIFTNENGSEGILYLISTDTTMTFQQIITTYQKRWGVEDYHKSLKNNTSIQKSPTKTLQTQANHLFASLCAYIKLEQLKIVKKINHFALKEKLYIKAIQASFAEFKNFKLNLA